MAECSHRQVEQDSRCAGVSRGTGIAGPSDQVDGSGSAGARTHVKPRRLLLCLLAGLSGNNQQPAAPAADVDIAIGTQTDFTIGRGYTGTGDFYIWQAIGSARRAGEYPQGLFAIVPRAAAASSRDIRRQLYRYRGPAHPPAFDAAG